MQRSEIPIQCSALFCPLYALDRVPELTDRPSFFVTNEKAKLPALEVSNFTVVLDWGIQCTVLHPGTRWALRTNATTQALPTTLEVLLIV